MSHELRTPLTAIIGYSDLLLLEAGRRAYTDIVPDVEHIQRAGRHLLVLINDVLDLSKIEAGKMHLELEPFALGPCVEEIATTTLLLVKKNGNVLNVQCAPDLGEIYADKTRLRQILLNLLGNAAKFTSQGTITLQVTRVQRDGADWFDIAVTDTGIGISPAQLQLLFQDFMQVDASTTRRYGGTGLGLALTRRICQMMGGFITVASEVDVGSTFTVSLPTVVQVKSEQYPQRSGIAPAPVTLSGLAPAPHHVQPLLLIIDDDPVVFELLSRSLAHTGLRFEMALSGEEGLRLARSLRPDLITLDVLLPDMDGWLVLSELKADPDLANIPVIVATIMDDHNAGFALGAAGYLSKPFTVEQISGLVQSNLRLAPIHAQADGPILVVEDDAALREIVRRTLEQQGWNVVEAADGRAALRQVAQYQPALILLDLMLPELDGIQVIDALAADPRAAATPILVMTAKDLSATEREQLNLSVADILQKGTYSSHDLVEHVRANVLRYLPITTMSHVESTDV
jgi:CheY-like chemotaxis protein/anti-sigma regulatory factor (Ser/Thr protein kinase)